MSNKPSPELGLRQNWQQFTLLVLVNAFVGGMVGLERSIFPEFAEQEFGVQSATAILSFITAFGFSKAMANYFTGRLINQWGRRRLLLIGWFIALPVPFLLIYAPSWNWVIFSNILLGLSQGLTWSATIIMKIDLVGQKDRGLAMGLNEFAGYFSVGLVAFLTGFIASEFGVTPYPFYLGIGLVLAGLLTTAIWVKDTRSFVQQEQKTDRSQALENVFIQTSFRHKTLSSVTQAGLVNNLNDGMIWGLFPMLLIGLNYSTESIGILAAIYPSVWGFGQLFTGKMADHYSKKKMLFWGMLLQGVAILVIPFALGFTQLAVLAALLGAGTALVYPTFLTTIASATSPLERGESIGTFRLWRDLGYVFGAILSGILADLFGLVVAILAIGVLTIASSLVIQFRMPKE
jgi:MFS family permease